MRLLTAFRRVPAASDVGLAAGVVAFLVAVTPQMEPEAGERPIDAVAYALVALAGAALAVRRWRPLAVVVAVTAALTVYLARDYPGGPVFVTALVAFYSLATAWDRRRALVVAASASGWLVAVGLALATGPGLVHLVFAGWAAAAVFLGDAVQSRRRHLVALEERARDLEQRREQETARRVAEERLRIARDLHDSVAHSMTAINVQAGAAVHVVDRRPEQAREAESTGGEALLSPGVTRRLIAEFASRASRAAAHPQTMDVLTDREREVVGLVAEGLTNDEIAAELVVSPATARTHVSRAMIKLHARDRAQLVVFAYQSGLVAPPRA